MSPHYKEEWGRISLDVKNFRKLSWFSKIDFCVIKLNLNYIIIKLLIWTLHDWINQKSVPYMIVLRSMRENILIMFLKMQFYCSWPVFTHNLTWTTGQLHQQLYIIIFLQRTKVDKPNLFCNRTINLRDIFVIWKFSNFINWQNMTTPIDFLQVFSIFMKHFK